MVANKYAIVGTTETSGNLREEQFKNYWKLLGHYGLGLTEIRIINFITNKVFSRFVDNQKDFIETLFFHGNKENNVFVGVNPRIGNSGTAKDISYVCNIVLDLDD